MSEEKLWIRIAKDPLGRDIVNAISLGKEGVAFAGYAVDVSAQFWDNLDKNAQRYFEIVDEADITDEEMKASQHNRNRNQRFRDEAVKAAAVRRKAIEKAAMAAAISQQIAAMTDDFPDSDDD